MPSFLAASSMVEPSGTETDLPSICDFNGVAFALRRRLRHGATRQRNGRLGRVERLRNFCDRWTHENRFHRCIADSSALDAVWPRPQIEASRMAWAISRNIAISCAAEPSGLAFTKRCSVSC